jgi:outer membrane protein
MKKIVVMLALGLMIGTVSFAQQAQKLAYIDSKALLGEMPEIKKANTDIEAFAKQYRDQMESMEKEGQKKVQEYQAGEKTMSDAVKTVKQKELQDLQNRIQSFQQTAEEKVGAKQQELYKPILDKANKAINDVAKEKGYSYVFDLSTGSLLYANETDNILTLVKAKLGIK